MRKVDAWGIQGLTILPSGGMLENNCDKMLINNHHQTTRELTDVN